MLVDRARAETLVFRLARHERDAWVAVQGNDEMLRAARNTLLGETWVERGEAPEWQRLADRRETFDAQIPKAVCS